MRFLFTLCLCLPAVAPAQPPRGFFPWWDSPIVRDLNVTDDQTRQIRAIVREYRERLIDHRGAVEKTEGEVQDLFNEDTVDQSRANAAIERLVSARADLTRTFTVMSLKLRAVLNPAQYKELQRRRPQGPAGPRPNMDPAERRPRMGPGGPGRGPPDRSPDRPAERPPGPPAVPEPVRW